MRKKYKRKSNAYVVGNNAVAYAQYEENNEAYVSEVVKVSKPRRERYSIDPMYTFMLSFVIIAMLIICVIMLKTQFSVADTSEHIIELKNELNEAKKINAHLDATINNELDLVEIKRIAIEEYGMVYPTGDDIIIINTESSSYTVQYTSIELPEKKEATLGNMLAFITRGW